VAGGDHAGAGGGARCAGGVIGVLGVTGRLGWRARPRFVFRGFEQGDESGLLEVVVAGEGFGEGRRAVDRGFGRLGGETAREFPSGVRSRGVLGGSSRPSSR
jgi:hypothetical protein